MITGVERIGKTAFAVSLIRKMAIENHCRIAFFFFWNDFSTIAVASY